MSGRRRAAARSKQVEPIGGDFKGFLQTPGVNASRSELNRKPNSVEPAAYFANNGRIRITQLEAVPAGGHALNE
jgi:hypothetical protein